MTDITQKSRSLREGIVSLAAVQAAEYLVPLLALPYLLRVLGAANYGKIAFTQAFCMYFVIVTEYGFNLTGTRLVAIHRWDKPALSRIFWEVQFTKIVFFTVSVVVLLICVDAFDNLRQVSSILYIGLLPVIGCVMYPLWLFQGLERMREAALLMIGVRVILLIGIVLFVKGTEDLRLAAMLQFGATPVAGIISWGMLAEWKQIAWVRPRCSGIFLAIRDSWHTFLATAASTLYRSSNAVVLGLVSGPTAVAYYSLAEKIVKAVQEINRPISQASYPRISALAAQSKEAAMPLLRQILLVIGGLSFAASIMLFVFAEHIIQLIAGGNFGDAALALRCMAFIPLIGSLNTVFGTQTLLPLGYSKYFSRFVLAAGIFNLIIIVPLVHLFVERGAALSFILSELLLLILMHVFLRARGITYF